MKNRSLVAVFVLSIVTLGIYDIYWLAKTKTVLNKETTQHTPSIWLLFVPLILFIVDALLITVGKYATIAGTSARGDVNTSSVLFGILIVLSAIFIASYWFFKFSKAVNEYTKGKMSTAVSFLTLYLVDLIGVVLIQDAFNNMGLLASATTAGTTTIPGHLVPTTFVPAKSITDPMDYTKSSESAVAQLTSNHQPGSDPASPNTENNSGQPPVPPSTIQPKNPQS